MAQFDVYKNPDGDGYLLVVQADLLDNLNTRMVVPLLPENIAPIPARTLNPCFVISGEKQVMSTQFMAAVPAGILHGRVTNLEPQRDEIIAALDFLLLGC